MQAFMSSAMNRRPSSAFAPEICSLPMTPLLQDGAPSQNSLITNIRIPLSSYLRKFTSGPISNSIEHLSNKKALKQLRENSYLA
jgi:hypothetical protein